MSELYLIEFFVDRLLIDYQTAKDAGGDAAYMLKMTAIGFPSVDIHPVKNSEGVNYFSKGGNNSERSLGLDLRAGKAFHIASPPLDLVKKMANNPLSIRLFREGDSFPLSTAEVPLSGCLCDQLDRFNEGTVQQPYVFGGRFGLLDPGGNPAGCVDVAVRVTRYGRYIIAGFVLEKESRVSFLFKNESPNDDGELFNVGSKEYCEDENEEEGSSIVDLMPRVAGISPCAGRLLSVIEN